MPYIVVEQADPGLGCHERALVLVDSFGSEVPVLGHGVAVTVFASKKAAEQAIARTREYAKSRNYKWGPVYKVRPIAKKGATQKKVAVMGVES